MRDLGWEIEDYSLDEETKNARHGLDANEYALEQNQKKLAKTSENIKHAKALESSISSEITKLSNDKQKEIELLAAAQEKLQKVENAQAPLKKKLEDEINTLNSEKNELKTEVDTLKKSKAELDGIEEDLPIKKKELGKLKSDIADLQDEEKNLNGSISKLKKMKTDLNNNINDLFWFVFDRVLFLFKGLANHAKTNRSLLDYINNGNYE